MNRQTFRLLFGIAPLAFGIAAPLAFEASNLLWGSLFGLGVCLGAYADGGLYTDGFWVRLGLLYALALPFVLYFASERLWRKLAPERQRLATWLLLASFLLVAPIDTIWHWDRAGFHLPDFAVHVGSIH